jgi:salicylate hydroxylase
MIIILAVDLIVRGRLWGARVICYLFREIAVSTSLRDCLSRSMMATAETSTSAPFDPVENGDAQKPLDIAIIGGGIGGLCLLLGIIEHTDASFIRPHLYESASAFSEIGAGVGFGPNAVQAMSIINPALSEAFKNIASNADVKEVDGKKVAVWNEFRMGMDGRTERNPLKAGEVVTSVCFESFKKNVHRAAFLEEMIKLLPTRESEGYVSFRKRCVEIEDLGLAKGVRVHFEDGSAVEADAVVGCDGVKSRVRQIMLTRTGDTEAINPQFTGKYAYRGLIPMDEAVVAFGEAARRSSIISGYDGHLVCFPIDKGKTLNVVAFQTQPEGKWDHQDWVIPASIDQVLEDYREWSNPVKDLLKGLRKPDIWALFEHPPAKSYWDGQGKLCLLGDCAHAR